MNYEINVSRLELVHHGKQINAYRHLFATAPRSLLTFSDAKRLLPEIYRAFPGPAYLVEVRREEQVGHYLNSEDLEEILR